MRPRNMLLAVAADIAGATSSSCSVEACSNAGIHVRVRSNLRSVGMQWSLGLEQPTRSPERILSREHACPMLCLLRPMLKEAWNEAGACVSGAMAGEICRLQARTVVANRLWGPTWHQENSRRKAAPSTAPKISRSQNAAMLKFQEMAACGRTCDFNDVTSLTHFETAKHSRQELSLIQGQTKEFPPQCLRISCVTCFSTGYRTNSTARLQPSCRLARAQRPNPPGRTSSCALYIIFITQRLSSRPCRGIATVCISACRQSTERPALRRS